MMKDGGHTLYIHMGMPKTGSTSLQSFLSRSNALLNSCGFEYPNVYSEFPELREKYTCSSANASLFVEHEIRGCVKDEEAENRVWDYLENRLERNNVIVSEERLWEADKFVFLQKAKSIAKNVKIIIFLRDQKELIKSAWKQMVQQQVCSLSYSEFVMEQKDMLLYSKVLDSISEVIGSENIILRKYYGQDVIVDFLQILGIENYAEEKRLDCKRYNLSISDEAANLKKNINRVPFIDDISKMSYGYFYLPDAEKTYERKMDNDLQIKNLCNQISDSNGDLFEKYKIDLNSDFCPNDFIQEKQYSQSELNNILIYFIMKERMRYSFWIEPLFQESLEKRLNGRQLAYFGGGAFGTKIINSFCVRPNVIIDTYFEGKRLLGIDVIKPSEVKDWHKLFVIITTSDYVEIGRMLEEKGMKHGVDYVSAYEIF